MNILLTFDEKYYLTISRKYGWQELTPDMKPNPVTYQEYAAEWLKRKIATEILEPEYKSFQSQRIEEIKIQVSEEAKNVINAGLMVGTAAQ
jgi:hypothetical protein